MIKRCLAVAVFWVMAAAVLPASAAQTPARGLFVSVIQTPPVLSSREAIESLVTFAESAGVRTLFVQIYRENKAWFPSSVADDSPYRECSAKVGEDPLALLIRRAHEKGIQVHAWINLLSLGSNTAAPILQKHGPSILTKNSAPKKSLKDYAVGGQYFLEPGDRRVRRELGTVVAEILGRYPQLDGIQLDYIRYPDTHPSYGHTKANLIGFYRFAGRQPTDEQNPLWRRWKEFQVTGLVKELAKKARRLRPGLQVSTTGLAPFYHAYLESFQNWKDWIDSGLTDFVTLMLYPPTVEEYKKELARIHRDAPNLEKVNIAVGAYKLLQEPQIFTDQFLLCEESGGRACVVFHYGNLVEAPALQGVLKEPRSRG